MSLGPRLTATLAATATALALVSCSDAKDDPTEAAEPAAEDLATALAAGVFTDAPLVGDQAQATTDFEAVTEGLGDLTPTVELKDVEANGAMATATYTWTWALTDDLTWTYDTEATLTQSGEVWQAAYDRSLIEPSLTESKVLDLSTLSAKRGDILGAKGLALVTDRQVARIGIDKTKVSQQQAPDSARALAELVDIEPGPYAKLVAEAGDKAFIEAIVLRSEQVPPDLPVRAAQIKGAHLIKSQKALGITKEFAAPILGTVGPVTGEMLKDNPGVYETDDEAGLSGLEARYDEQLRGAPGLMVESIDSGGQRKTLFESKAVNGRPLELTLDADLQTAAEDLLKDVGPESAIVAIRPSDGAILAAANGPGNGGQNLATFGQYAPGSTFKAVTSLALLRNGVTPQTSVECPATVTVDGKQFKNYSDYPSNGLGTIPLSSAVANSCNTAFINERDKLAPTDLVDAAASLGMGVDHDLGFPAYFGQVEPSETETESAANLIGQGKILASPMAMATVVASIQAGQVVLPQLITSVDPDPADAKALTKQEASQLQGLLRAVVTQGSGRALGALPGPPVIAKTGTAEFGSDNKIDTHAWMIGAQGDLAVAVFLGVGESGSQTAGPILADFLRAAQG